MWGPQWGMMGGGYGYGYGGFPFGMILWIVIIIAVIAGMMWLMRSCAVCGMGHRHHDMPPRRSSGLDVLEERYARGDINRDEYLQKKKDIEG